MNEGKILKVIIKKFWLILILAFIITGFAALYFTYTERASYQAKTILYVIATSDNQKPLITIDSAGVSQRLIRDYGELVKSEKIVTAVIKRLNLSDVTEEELISSVDVNIVTGSNLLQLSVTNANPQRAQVVANAFSEVLIEEMIPITYHTNISIVDKVNLPVCSIQTNKPTKVFAAFILSFIIICILVTLPGYINNTVQTIEKLEKELDYKVIGIVPKMDIK